MSSVVIVTFLVSFFITLILIPLTRKISLRINFVDMPGERKVHQFPIPLGGGITIFLGIGLTFALAILCTYYLNAHKSILWFPKEIYEYLPGVSERLPELIVIFIGALAMVLLGLIDDVRRLSARTKLIAQIIISSFVIGGGIKFSLFLGQFGAWGAVVSFTATLFWMILVTNSFNLLDHMDGLSSGIAAIASLIFLVIALRTGEYFIACFLITIIGSCFAFLIFNFHPAKIFMGDTGSLLLGYLISVLTILFTFYKEQRSYYAIATPILVVAIPIFDTLAVVIIRLRNKKPIFRGDKNHVAHRLIALGMKVPQAVLLIYVLTLCAGLSAILLYCLNRDPLINAVGALLIFSQVILLLVIVTILEFTGRKNKNNTEGQ